VRRSRLEHSGALYHVIIRGNQRQKTFNCDNDYARYLKLLGERLEPRSFILYAYCLMPEHVHLLIEQASEYPLSRYMQRLQSAYTNYFNHRYGGKGNVFKGRYRVILVDKKRYLAEMVRHIHLNPHRSGLADAECYPWSSHRQYLGTESRILARVETNVVLSLSPGDDLTEHYLEFMEKGKKDDFRGRLYDLKDGKILGDMEFARETHERAGARDTRGPLKIRKGIGQIWAELKSRENLDEEPMGWTRSRLMAEAAYLAVEGSGWKQKEVADYFKIGPPTVCKAVKKYERKLLQNLDEGQFSISWTQEA
jgi:REP element-mobilizing transposase RayT